MEHVPAHQAGRALNVVSHVTPERSVLDVAKFVAAKMEAPATSCPGNAPAWLATSVHYAKKYVRRALMAICARASVSARTVAPVIQPMVPAPVRMDGPDLPVPTLAQSDSTEATVVSSACAKMGPLVTRGRDSAHAVRDMSESFAKKNVLMELTG